MKALAVDIGGSHIACAAVEDRQILESVNLPVDSGHGLMALLPVIKGSLEQLAAKHGGAFAGVVCGFCGLVDSNAGRVISTNHKYSDATAIDFLSWGRNDLGLPLILENDARMALLGERFSGTGMGVDDLVMITLGTGIGSAAIMNGKLVRGRHFQAGCLGGHFTIELNGRPCSCGSRGCFEAEASTYALPEICRNWPGFACSELATELRLDFKTLFRCADVGDQVAREVRERCISIWAACAFALVHAYDPEVLIVGGGVMTSGYPILEIIQHHLDSFAWTPWGKVLVKSSALGSSAALLGAVPLLLEQK